MTAGMRFALLPIMGIFAHIPAYAEGAEAYELSPIVVTSDLDKQNSPLITAPGSFVKKDGQAVKLNTPRGLKSAVGLEPNVDFGGGPRKSAELPQIRGLSSERILILQDGVRENFRNGHDGRGLGDYSLIENLEIVKGPWSSLYGSGAMGGVFSIRRATAKDFIRRSRQNNGVEAALESASANAAFGQRITGFAKAGAFEPLLSVHHLKSSDQRLGGGEDLPYSSSESQDFYSALSYDFGPNQNFTLKLDRYRDDSKTPLDPQVDTNTLNELGSQAITKTDFIGDYNLVRSRFDLHAKPYLRETSLEKTRLSDGRVDAQIVKTTGIDAWNNLKLDSGENIKAVVTAGFEYFKDQNTGKRNGVALDSFPNGTSEQWGLYLQPTLTFSKKFSLVPGIRYDSFMNKAPGQVDNSGDKTSLKAYATYEYLPEKTFFAGWGQAYNAPRLQDLYVSGQHFPGNFFAPNPRLKPEIADTWEVGAKNQFRLKERVLSLNAAYFNTKARDFISRHVDMGAGRTTFENLDRVSLHGFELSALLQSERFGLGLSYGSTRSWNETNGAPLEDTLPDKWIGKFEFYSGDDWIFGGDMVLSDKQDRVPSGVQTTAGYFVQNLYVSYSKKPYEIHFRIDNVYDRAYRKHNSAINEAGRDIRLTVSRLF
jgi:hemoglobin/transferrin/lactoferrin receptor protein